MGSGRISLLTGLYGHKLRQQHLQEDINSMFDFMNPLGNSRSSSVWKARHRSSKKLIALKGIELDRAHNTNPIGRFSSLSVSTTGTNSSSSTTAYYADPVEQFQFLSKLDHPNIVKYYECHMYSTFCYISKEYCSGKYMKNWCENHLMTNGKITKLQNHQITKLEAISICIWIGYLGLCLNLRAFYCYFVFVHVERRNFDIRK